MVVVADASVAIRGDMSGFSGDLRRAEGETRASAGRMELTFKNILKAGALFGIGTSLHSLVQNTIRELGDAATAFSELQQTQRTTDDVFGESAKVIEDWAARSAEAAGMSQRTVFQSAAVMGQTLRNMGFDADEAADKVVQLQQRAAEMAIAFGQTPDRAILAITAAMRGERDTIEKFGVSIKQVDVNSRVAAMGLDVSTDAAKKNADAIAILDIILSQTADQAGRFGDGQDDLAVKMAQTAAKIDDFMTTQVGPAVASIQLGAINTASFFGEQLDTFSLNFGDQVQTIMRLADENGVHFDVMKQRIINAMDFTGLSFPEVVATFSVEGINVSDQVEQEYMDAAQAAGAGVGAMARQMALGGPVVAAEAGKIAGMLPAEIQARVDEIRAAGANSIVEFAAGMLDKQSDPLLAMEALARANETALTRSAEITRLLGQLHSTELAAGLTDGRAEVRDAAHAARTVIEERLRSLNAWQWGYNLIDGYALGIETATRLRLRSASVGAASAVGAQLQIRSEPPDHSSPLYGVTQWGGNIIRTIAEGMLGELSTGAAAARAAAGALVPSLAPGAASVAGAAMVGTGETKIVQLIVDGVPFTFNNPREMVVKLEEIAETWG